MNANSTGSIEHLANGKWRVRVSSQGKRKTLGTFETEKEAQRFLRVWVREMTTGRIVAPGKVTLSQFASEWLDKRELMGSRRRAEVRSIESERSVWRAHVETSALAKMPIDAIEREDIEDFVVWLRGRHASISITRGSGSAKHTTLEKTDRSLSRSMQREALRLVRAVLDEAVRRRDIKLDVNPALDVGLALGGPAPKSLDDAWLREEQIDTLLACESISIRDRTVYACAIGLALRLNDIKGLRPGDVDLDCQVPGPHVSLVIQKTQKHHRVPIMPWLVPWLREHIASLPRGARWLFPNADGCKYGEGFDFFWAEHRERVDGVSQIKRESALHRAGIKQKIRFHDLRGTCATHLALGSWGRVWSLTEIKMMLAHSDQRVTEVYTRRALDPLSTAAAATSGPKLSRESRGSVGVSAGNHLAPGPGLEPGTIRLTAGAKAKQPRVLSAFLDRVVDRSNAVFELCDSDSMLALALAVLESAATMPPELIQLAVQVCDPRTTHRARRAGELAERVLTTVEAHTQPTAPVVDTGA